MKLRLFFTPSIVAPLLGLTALLLWSAALAVTSPLGRLPLLLAALFYSALFAIAAWSLWRIQAIERWQDWNRPQRLLVLAPHEDDCVISAGGIGSRNRELGGVTRIVYLAPDETPGMAERRAAEAREAWQIAGVGPSDLKHFDLLPSLVQQDPLKLRVAARTLRAIIDEFQPSVVVMPMFEGGHVQHDMVVGLMGEIVTPQDSFEVFEAPEYSPYASLQHTPQRLLALSARWLFGLVSYYGPPDGIDERPVLKMRLTPEEIDRKRRMLAAFVSQNASSLVETRGYPDRLVHWDRSRIHRRPFALDGSYLGFVMWLHRLLPPRLVDRLLPVQLGTIGRDGRITDWAEEWSPADPPA
jgi:LmbE family N-acetylglucosaminyl deacetylase